MVIRCTHRLLPVLETRSVSPSPSVYTPGSDRFLTFGADRVLCLTFAISTRSEYF